MRKIFMAMLFLMAIIFSMSLISAVVVYSGEPITIELEKQFDYYSIVGNSSEVILDIVQDGNNVTITPNKYSKSDSYEVIFFDKEKETITIYKSSGGSGGRTKYVDRNVSVFVPTYLDREVIKEVPGVCLDEKICGEDLPFYKQKLFYRFVGIFALLLVITIFISKLILNNVERRFKKNE